MRALSVHNVEILEPVKRGVYPMVMLDEAVSIFDQGIAVLLYRIKGLPQQLTPGRSKPSESRAFRKVSKGKTNRANPAVVAQLPHRRFILEISPVNMIVC